MIKAYYENSKGEILNLLSYPFLTAEADWFDAEWEDDVGGFIRTVQLDVFGKNEEDVSQNMEQLYSVLGADAEAGKFGKLYVNDTYLPCRIKASKKVTFLPCISKQRKTVWKSACIGYSTPLTVTLSGKESVKMLMISEPETCRPSSVNPSLFHKLHFVESAP